jgi:hypothetical protein
MKHRLLALAAIFVFFGHGGPFAQECAIVVASTTSTEQSGLFGFSAAGLFREDRHSS